MNESEKYRRAACCLLAAAVAALLALACAIGAARPPVVPPDPEAPPQGLAGNTGQAPDGQPREESVSLLPAVSADAEAPDRPAEKAPPEGALTAADILPGSQLVAHGMGSVDGIPLLNSRESFLTQYRRGLRVFEVDLRLTVDLEVVCRHDWRAGWQEGIQECSVPTLDQFLAEPILDAYTPLSFRDLLLLMEEYPDICVITDTKFTDAEIVTVQFQKMLEDAADLGLSYLFNRMVIQVYSDLMFSVVDSVHHFPYYIYTLYTAGFGRTEEAFRELAEFCRDNGILGLTMWDYWWKPAYAPIAAEYGIRVCVHVVDDPEAALSLLESGVNGIYTNELCPADLAPEEEKGVPHHGHSKPDRENPIQPHCI